MKCEISLILWTGSKRPFNKKIFLVQQYRECVSSGNAAESMNHWDECQKGRK